jgi:hypothetical protein
MDVSNLSINSQNKVLDKYFPKGRTTRRVLSDSRASVEISDLSRELQSSKVDFAASSFSFQNDTLNFDVNFLKSINEEFSLDGYLTSSSQKSQVNLKYKFEHAVAENKTTVNRMFESSLQITFEKDNSLKTSKITQKEDILGFLRKFTSEITDILDDKKKTLMAVVLNKEDIRDLTNIDDQRITDIVNSLINTVVTSARMKNMLNNSANTEKAIYKPEKRVDDVTTTENNFRSYLDYRFEIKEIQNEPADSTPKETALQ